MPIGIFRDATLLQMVFHLAANADVRFGTDHPRRDLEQNTIATFNVLEAMRHQSIRNIVFASTGSVYGEAEKKGHQKFHPRMSGGMVSTAAASSDYRMVSVAAFPATQAVWFSLGGSKSKAGQIYYCSAPNGTPTCQQVVNEK